MPQLLRPASPLRIVSRGYRKPVRPQLIRNHPLNRGLVGCWLLGDVGPKGITADLTGVNPGTLVNGPTLAPSHHGGLALNFTRTSTQSITLPNVPILNISGPITILAWFKTSDTTNGKMILGGYKLTSAFDGYGFGIAVSGANPHKLEYWSSIKAAWVGSTTSVDDGKWHLGAVSTNSSTASFYLDGKADGTPASNVPGAWAGVRAIGALSSGSGSNFQDSLEFVQIYNRLLSASEHAWKFAEPYAGIADYRPDWRVGAGAAPASGFYYIPQLSGSLAQMGGGLG